MAKSSHSKLRYHEEHPTEIGLSPMPPFFLVKVARKTRDTGGRIIVPDTIKFMAYNLQCGEIVGIGEFASQYFPEAKIGLTLIFHHFVEGEDEYDARTNHLVYQTDKFNYYIVTVTEYNGKMNETYGVWDGEKIIPNKDYIFLKLPEKEKSDIDFDSFASETGLKVNIPMSVSESGLLIFKNWEDSRDVREEKQAELKKEVQELSKSGNHKLHIKQEILKREWEMEAISRDINKKEYIPFKVAYYNRSLLLNIENIKEIKDEDVYVLNIAAHTIVKFKNVEYIVAKSSYVACIISNP